MRKLYVRRPNRRIRQQTTRRFFISAMAMVIALTSMAMLSSPADAHRSGRQREDVMTQGGGGVYAEDGARMRRLNNRISIRWKVKTPEPESYLYPTADMVPPGAPPHPVVEAGRPEVFTLWPFVFNHPELCSAPCDFDDIGDTPAQGGIYQLDTTVARHRKVRMNGKVRVGEAPVAGVALADTRSAEVHVAMAPHGKARTGAELDRQRQGAIGSPPFWFAAVFLSP